MGIKYKFRDRQKLHFVNFKLRQALRDNSGLGLGLYTCSEIIRRRAARQAAKANQARAVLSGSLIPFTEIKEIAGAGLKGPKTALLP